MGNEGAPCSPPHLCEAPPRRRDVRQDIHEPLRHISESSESPWKPAEPPPQIVSNRLVRIWCRDDGRFPVRTHRSHDRSHDGNAEVRVHTIDGRRGT